MRIEAIDRLDATLNRLEASLFLDSTTIDAARRAGVDDVVALIFGGRIAAMGAGGEAEMIEAFAFVSPTLLSAKWNLAASGMVGSVAREVIEPFGRGDPGDVRELAETAHCRESMIDGRCGQPALLHGHSEEFDVRARKTQRPSALR